MRDPAAEKVYSPIALRQLMKRALYVGSCVSGSKLADTGHPRIFEVILGQVSDGTMCHVHLKG